MSRFPQLVNGSLVIVIDAPEAEKKGAKKVRIKKKPAGRKASSKRFVEQSMLATSNNGMLDEQHVHHVPCCADDVLGKQATRPPLCMTVMLICWWGVVFTLTMIRSPRQTTLIFRCSHFYLTKMDSRTTTLTSPGQRLGSFDCST